MDLTQYENSIIIAKDMAITSLIKKLSKTKKIVNIKFISLSEFKKKYFFDYSKEAIFYVSKKYDVIPEIAKIYIENLYFIDNDNHFTCEKVDFLGKLKKDLMDKSLIKEDVFFKNYLKEKTIILYELKHIDKLYTNAFSTLKTTNNIIEYNDNSKKTKKNLYRAKNKNEEVAFIASEIAKLIKLGIDINHIKLANVQDNYRFTVTRIFKDFNIPVDLNTGISINGTNIVNEFKSLYSNDLKVVFEVIKKMICTKEDKNVYDKLIEIVNSYNWCDDYSSVKDMIFTDIKNAKIKEKKLKNAVRLIDITDDIIDENDYVFLINFNQGVIPISKKDEDYLSDATKEKLGIDTSIDINVKKTSELREKISNISNLIVTASLHDLTSELYISNAYDEELFEDCKIDIDYTSSNSYNIKRLISAEDEYSKFGTITDEYRILKAHYDDFKYRTYDNTFKGIDKEELLKVLKGKLLLSYTSMNAYYECGFRYYLEQILRVNKYEENFENVLGTIFHNILSECFTNEHDFETLWIKNIEGSTYKFNDKEKFFLDKVKSELIFTIETIKKQMEYTALKNAVYERKIEIPINEMVTFKGFIDKILYSDTEIGKIAAIIDYKTGNQDINLDNTYYGLGMQLPVYVYLLKHDDFFKDAQIGGFYLQRILNNEIDIEKRKESLKLLGYSNGKIEILEKVDSTYENSKIIKSLRMGSNGFYAYSKLITDNELDRLTSLVKKKIDEASNEILKGNFKINPKEIDGKIEGCKFCKFKDICYKTPKDSVKLKSVSKEYFLGGDKNA